MIFSKKIVGSRVYLYTLDSNTVSEKYISWLNQPDVNRYLELRFLKNDRQSTVAYVEEMSSSSENYFFGIYLSNSGTHIGNIKLGPIDFNHLSATIGIMIGDGNFWGQGYATEAIELLKEFAFKRLNLLKLNAGCYSSNVGSTKAFLKAGFSQEGLQKSQVICDGARSDVILYGLVRQEFD